MCSQPGVKHLELGSAKYGLWIKSKLPPIFVSEVLSKCSHTYAFTSMAAFVVQRQSWVINCLPNLNYRLSGLFNKFINP